MVFIFTHQVSAVIGISVRSQASGVLKGGSSMPDETHTLIVSRSVEEDKGTSGVVQEVFAAENCSAECPTCQQSCALTAGHAGLHHCENGHDWV